MKVLKNLILFFSPIFVGCTYSVSSNPIEIEGPNFKNIELKITETKATTPKDFKKISDRNQFLVKNLFVYAPSPYVAQISEEVHCPKKFHPVSYSTVNNSLIKMALEIFADDRYNYGVCNESNAKFISLYAQVFCKTKGQSFEVKIFLPLNEHSKIEQIFKALRCTSS